MKLETEIFLDTHSVREIGERIDDLRGQVANLAILVRRLCRAIPTEGINCGGLKAQALNYLASNGLQGKITRRTPKSQASGLKPQA